MCGLCSLKRANNNSQNPGNEVMMMLVTQYLSFRAKLRVWAPSCCCSHIQVISNYVQLCSGARKSLTIYMSPEMLPMFQEFRAFLGHGQIYFSPCREQKNKDHHSQNYFFRNIVNFNPGGPKARAPFPMSEICIPFNVDPERAHTALQATIVPQSDLT